MFSMLAMIPGLSKIKKAFNYIEYVMIIGLAFALFVQITSNSTLRAEIAKERADVALLKKANQMNLDTIETLRDWQFQQTQVFLDLDKKVNDIQTTARVLRLDLATLGRNDEASRTYLNTPIPSGLKRLLNNPAEVGGDNQTRSTGQSIGSD